MKKDFGLVFWIHLIFIIAAWTSPLWADWKLILIGILILAIQYFIIGGCYLTFLETGKDTKITFYYYYLSKIFPTINKNNVFITVRYIVPVLILSLAFILQVCGNLKPLLRF